MMTTVVLQLQDVGW